MRGYGYWNPGVGHGAWTWSLFVILVVWAGIFLLVFLVFHHPGERHRMIYNLQGVVYGHENRALRMLEQRFARGEITADEFRIAKALRFGNPPPPPTT